MNTRTTAEELARERELDGIQLSDDRLPALRARVYALSVARRRGR